MVSPRITKSAMKSFFHLQIVVEIGVESKGTEGSSVMVESAHSIVSHSVSFAMVMVMGFVHWNVPMVMRVMDIMVNGDNVLVAMFVLVAVFVLIAMLVFVTMLMIGLVSVFVAMLVGVAMAVITVVLISVMLLVLVAMGVAVGRSVLVIMVIVVMASIAVVNLTTLRHEVGHNGQFIVISHGQSTGSCGHEDRAENHQLVSTHVG